MQQQESMAVAGTVAGPSFISHTESSAAATRMIDVVFPERANHHGTLFGGAALALMDKLAFVVATRATRRAMVTACSGRIDFHTPVAQGQVVELRGEVVRRGNRSVDVDIQVLAEDLETGEVNASLGGRFTLVAVGDARSGPQEPECLPIVPAGIGPEVSMVEMVFPGHTNHFGTLYGGQALAWLGKAAFVVAARHARMPVVMAASERIDFHAPVLEGEIVDLAARVVRVGNSSMCVEVVMHAEELLTGKRRLCTRGRFTMVAIGYDGKPVAVPQPPCCTD